MVGSVRDADQPLNATKLILARAGRENFSEVRWQEASIRDISAQLEGTE
jgi:hypothetical protein